MMVPPRLYSPTVSRRPSMPLGSQRQRLGENCHPGLEVESSSDSMLCTMIYSYSYDFVRSQKTFPFNGHEFSLIGTLVIGILVGWNTLWRTFHRLPLTSWLSLEVWVGCDICTASWASRMVPFYRFFSCSTPRMAPSIMTAGAWSSASSNSTCSCDCYHDPLVSQTLLIWVRFPLGWTDNSRVVIVHNPPRPTLLASLPILVRGFHPMVAQPTGEGLLFW